MLYASLTPREDRVSVCVAAGGHPLTRRQGNGFHALAESCDMLTLGTVPDLRLGMPMKYDLRQAQQKPPKGMQKRRARAKQARGSVEV